LEGEGGLAAGKGEIFRVLARGRGRGRGKGEGWRGRGGWRLERKKFLGFWQGEGEGKKGKA
jgi:hypothetical protein